MRKLKIIEHISLDGIIQHSDDGDGFPFSDWTTPYRTQVGREAMLAAYGSQLDLLLGRRTYDIWSGYWPTMPANPMGDALNAATKYVVTHRPESLEWEPVVAIGSNLIAEVRQLKTQTGPDIVLSGSSTITSTLLEHGVVDEVWLAVYPILLGVGKRFFAGGVTPVRFELSSTQAFPSGIVLHRYDVKM
jgi:dihydrofolate reductase